MCKNPLASGGFAPRPPPGALPLDPTRGPWVGPWTPGRECESSASLRYASTYLAGTKMVLARTLVREVYCYCTLILRQALFCHQKFVISSLFPLINWKCPQQYLQGWSELTLVPKDVNLRKMLTSKVKITRVNWTGPSYSSGTLLLRTPQLPGRASAWS